MGLDAALYTIPKMISQKDLLNKHDWGCWEGLVTVAEWRKFYTLQNIVDTMYRERDTHENDLDLEGIVLSKEDLIYILSELKTPSKKYNHFEFENENISLTIMFLELTIDTFAFEQNSIIYESSC